MNKTKKILITGSNGMVGRNIVEFEKSKNYTLLTPKSSELNLLDRRSVDTYIKLHNPEIVIHCAGIVGGIEANMANPVKFLVRPL